MGAKEFLLCLTLLICLTSLLNNMTFSVISTVCIHYIYIYICDGVIVCGTRETRKEQMRIVARAGREIMYFILAAAFSESTKKTDVSIAVAERPRWSTMAANRIYISGESVFTPANHPRVQASYEGD